MRTSGNNTQFFRPGSAQADPINNLERHRVWLELKNDQGLSKQALVGYIENATNNYEAGFDGAILEAGNGVSLYSVLGTTKLSVQGRTLPFDINDQVPLGYHSSTAGNFQINLFDYDGLFLSQDVFIEDKLLNVIHNLKDGSYSFTTEAGTFEDRFVLRYTNSALAVNSPTLSDNSVVVYKQNSDIHIQTSNIIMKSVAIYDVRGRMIAEKKDINGSSAVFANLNMAHEVLMVKIIGADNSTVSKKIIF